MKILELFSGTHSIGKAFPNDEVISVDTDPHFNPTHQISIFDFDYKQYSDFDYIHASPPCRWYSGLQLVNYGRMRKMPDGETILFDKEANEYMCETESDLFVLKALEIIHYFNPKCWTIENPKSNSPFSLHRRPFMEDYTYANVSYCMYNYPIRKNTILYNNFGLNLKVCDKSHIHKTIGHNENGNGKATRMTLYEKYRIPHGLCLEIANQIRVFVEPEYTSPSDLNAV
jgi:hypothetical protein